MRPLHYAAWQGLMEPVTLLLQAGASPVEPSNNGETPIHFACQHGHVEVVRILQRSRERVFKMLKTMLLVESNGSTRL